VPPLSAYSVSSQRVYQSVHCMQNKTYIEYKQKHTDVIDQ